MEIGLIWGLRIIAAFQKWFQKLIHNPMNPLGTPYKSYLAIPIVVVISVLVTDIFYHNPSHAVDSNIDAECTFATFGQPSLQ